MQIRFTAEVRECVLCPVTPVELQEGQRFICEAVALLDQTAVSLIPNVMEVAALMANDYISALRHETLGWLGAARSALSVAQRDVKLARSLRQPYFEDAIASLDEAVHLLKSRHMEPPPGIEPSDFAEDIVAPAIEFVAPILSFGYAALAGVAAFLLGRKSAKGVMAAKIYLAADGLYYALALLDSMIGDATPQLNSSFPPWFKPSGYLIASVLWIVYLARSERVKNTYFLANAEVAQAPSRRSGWSQ
jgi:hypothetical protein